MKKFTLLIFASLLSICGYAQLAPESFEDAWVGSPAHPPGWTVINEQGPNVTWVQSAAGASLQPPNTGSHAAYLDKENVSPTSPLPKDWLITPYFNMPANGLLRFYSRLTAPGDQGGIYKVKISTDSDPANLASYTDLQTWTEAQINPVQTDYFEKVITLPAITGSVHIAFVMEGDNRDRWLIDDVKVVSQCFAPSNLTALNPTLDSIDLNWVNNGSAVSWNIEIVPDNQAPTGNGESYVGQPPYTKSGLLPNTSYKAYIKAVCSDQGTSEIIGPVFFNTAKVGESCAYPIVITPPPYSVTDNTANFADNYEGSPGTSCGGNGSNLSGNDVVYSYTPAANENININLSNIGNGAGMFVYDDCADIGISCIAGGTGNSTPINIPSLAVTANNTIYIVISTDFSAATTPYTLVIQKVNCDAPTGLAVSNPTGTTADFSWNAGTATSWQFAVQTVGTGLPTGAGQNVTQNNITVNQTLAGVPLTPATNYEIYVRANCGDGTYSIWTGPFMFATTQIPDHLNYSQDWETVPNGWTINNGTQVNKWIVGTATSNGGTHSLYISNDGIFNNYTTTSNAVVHAFRDITMPADVNQLNLSFDWKNIGEGGWDYIRVYLTPVTFNPTTGEQIEENSTNIKLAGELATGPAWSTFNTVVDASAYANTTMRLIFEWRNDGGGGSQPPAAIDNINFSIITCPAPSDPEIAANSLTNSQVIINWTAPTPASAQYDYYISGSPAAPNGTTAPTNTVTTTSATIPLTPGSSNYFWVRANCGTDDTSTWTGPLFFVAPQIPDTMDYVQNFDGATHGWALNNGTQINKWVVGSATSNSAANSLYISQDNGTTNTFNVDANSVVQAYRDIQMPATLDQIELSFDWKSVGDQFSDNFRVWLVPIDFTPTPGSQIFSGSGRVQIGNTFSGSSEWTHFSSIIQASTYAGTVKRLIFEWRNDQFGGTQAPAAIDNINFKVIPCPQPSALLLSGLTQSLASFTWTPPVSSVSGYEYYLSTDPTQPLDTASATGDTTTNTLVINDLPTSTQHYIWVRSSCTATSKSYWIGPLAFITPQIPAAMDYAQNFDNGPHEWQIVNGTQANKWVVGTATSKSAPNSLYISSDNGVNNGYILTSGSIVHAYRDITFPASIDDAILSFDWKCMGQAFDDYFRVWIVPVEFSPTPGTQITGGTGRQQLNGNHNDGSVWTTENITFNANAYQGQTRRIIFEWTNSQWGGGVQPPAAIDNINLYKVTCPVPSNLALGTNNTAGTSFTWTPPTSVTPTFDFYYSTTSTPPGIDTMPSGNVTSPSVTLSGLPDSSNYYFWVRDNCGAGSTSLWIGPVEFNTPQIPSPLNYTQNFDGNEYKWTLINGSQTNKWVVGSATSNSPSKSLYISNTGGETYNFNTSSGSVVHAYKDFIIPPGTNPLDLSFDWRNKGDAFGDFIRVWRVPTSFTPTSGAQITPAADREQIGVLLMNNSGWTNSSNILDPSTYAGTNIRIVFEWVNNTFSGDQPPGAIDNIDFSVITCPKPSGLGIDEITQSGATFDWTETGSATAWEVYIAQAGQPSPTADTVGVDAASNPFPYTTPELIPSTNYVYYVRSVCDPADKSKWSGPFAFRTAIANDECTGAYPIAVNPIDQDCTVSLTASYQGATPSAQPFECGGTNGADIWYEFVATSDRANIELSDFVAIGSPSPVVIALYQGDQCGSLLQVDCSGTNVLTAKNLIIGTTYKVRLYINKTPADLNTSFKVCINTPQLPANQNQSACTVTTVNYSFENPTPVPVVPPSPYPAMVNQNTVQGWRTTASDEIMEFWPSPNYENVPAYDGNQFVELNANLVSGLYQDYATPQTTTFTYSFAHRGRMGTDSCKLLAGPPGGPYVEVTTATTPNTGWQVYTGTYTTPVTGQTTTRFIFQSASTYNGDGSVGNFLDAIEFTADNGVLSVTPSSLTCIDNTATVVAAGSGEWSAHADNPSETVIADAESNTTTISGFVVSGTYRYDWTTQYCSSTIEVTFDNGNVPEPVTVTTMDYCVGETATPLTATPLANHTINWYTVATGGTAATTAPTPDTSINNVTIYYVSQLSDLNCESARVPITVTIHEVPPAPTTAATAIAYCEDATVTALTANALAGNTLNWYTVATGGTASTTAPIPVTDLPTGTTAPVVTSYYVSQISANSCESPRTEIVVTVNPSVVPVTDFTYAVTSICIADTNPIAIPSTGYTAGGLYSGDAGLIINPATGEINLAASVPGLHNVTYTVNPNPVDCNIGHSSTLQITITPLAVAETGFSYTTPLCSGTANQIPVLTTGFVTGGTFTADNAGLSIDAATGEINVGTSTAGTYTVTYTVGDNTANCVASGIGTATITITDQFNPVTGFDYDNSFCFDAADATPNLDANFTTGGIFTGTTGLVIDPATGTVNVADSTPGSHTVTYTFAGDASNCINSGTSTYTFTIGSELNFAFDAECQGNAFVITAVAENGVLDDNATYEWSLANGTTVGTNADAFNVSDYLTSTSETEKFPIEFFLTVTIDGCETTKSYTVEGITCTIQKGISPNNDGMNDSFDLQFMGVKKLEIFNRYGQEVYSKTNYKNEWIGQGSNGDELPTGTYYYVIERSAGGTNTGWIYINRQE